MRKIVRSEGLSPMSDWVILQIESDDHRSRTTPVNDVSISLMTDAEVIRLMIRRIRALPWGKNESGTLVYLPESTWRQWMREIDNIDGEPSP